MLREFTGKDAPVVRERSGAGRTSHNGRYFEAFAVEVGEQLVGCVSLYQRTASVVSLGVEIFEAHQGNGYGTQALAEAVKLAKGKGFAMVMDQVLIDNEASVAIHRKLGFECDGYVYKNQKDHRVCLWIKLL